MGSMMPMFQTMMELSMMPMMMGMVQSVLPNQQNIQTATTKTVIWTDGTNCVWSDGTKTVVK